MAAVVAVAAAVLAVGAVEGAAAVVGRCKPNLRCLLWRMNSSEAGTSNRPLCVSTLKIAMFAAETNSDIPLKKC